jgi:murein DD-endopeptidase MepM/ murein hydrolase activator NlpD
MQDGSIKVKKGQKIEAGTPLGKMGTTGMSTGKHLHWELRLGKVHTWNDTGKDYIEPIGFFKALIAMEASIASAPVVGNDAVVAPAPTHNAATAAKVEAERKGVAPAPVAKPAVKPVAKPATVAKPVVKDATAPAKPALKGELKLGTKNGLVTYLQKSLKVTGDTSGAFGPNTAKAVVALQKANNLKADGVVGPLTWSKIK